MDKKTIEKIITETFTKNGFNVKCSRNTLDKKDKKAIETFQQNRKHYPKNREERKELYKEHEKIQAEHQYTQKQIDAVHYWGEEGFAYMNGRIYNTKDYQDAIEEDAISDVKTRNDIKTLQKTIDESPRVPHDTVTVRQGHWEEGHSEGEVIVQKGFASTSYTDAIDVSHTDADYNYEITYYIPTGTKGVLLSDASFPQNLGEEELLLGKNTRQYILSQNDEDHTVEVLILPDR